MSLQASYTNLVYLGPVGSALITKVMSNMLCMLNAIGMAEAMMIGESLARNHLSHQTT